MIVNYKEFGEGEPLVILHGLFGSLDNWQTLAKRFAEKNRTFIVDQRNHGRSFHSDEMDYDVMAEDVVRLLDELGIDRAHVLGHSMGGKTAMNFAMSFPDRIDRLIVADIGPREYESKHEAILKALFVVHDRTGLASRKEAKELMTQFVQDEGVLMFLLKNLHWEEKGKLAWKMNLPVIADHMEDILAGLDEDIVKVPTLFLAGGGSDYLPEDDRMPIMMQFINAEILEIPGVGHWLHAEAPDDFYELVSQFLEA